MYIFHSHPAVSRTQLAQNALRNSRLLLSARGKLYRTYAISVSDKIWR